MYIYIYIYILYIHIYILYDDFLSCVLYHFYCFMFIVYVYAIRQNTKHAACATQIDRQVEKRAYTHDTDS